MSGGAAVMGHLPGQLLPRDRGRNLHEGARLRGAGTEVPAARRLHAGLTCCFRGGCCPKPGALSVQSPPLRNVLELDASASSTRSTTTAIGWIVHAFSVPIYVDATATASSCTGAAIAFVDEDASTRRRGCSMRRSRHLLPAPKTGALPMSIPRSTPALPPSSSTCRPASRATCSRTRRRVADQRRCHGHEPSRHRRELPAQIFSAGSTSSCADAGRRRRRRSRRSVRIAFNPNPHGCRGPWGR